MSKVSNKRAVVLIPAYKPDERLIELTRELKENDLDVVTRFMPISARFISNRASYQFKHQEIDTLLKKLSEVTAP